MNGDTILKLVLFLTASILNTLCVVYKLTKLENFFDFLTNISFITFGFTSLYYIYAFIKELKVLFCDDTHSKDHSFMRDTYFKFCFSFQGCAAVLQVHSKFKEKFENNSTIEGELVGYYSTIIVFVIMILTIHFTQHKVLTEKFKRDILILLLFIGFLFIMSSVLVTLSKWEWGYVAVNINKYLYVILFTTSMYQFYNWLIANKLGMVFDPSVYNAL